jgi:hypothetical protein
VIETSAPVIAEGDTFTVALTLDADPVHPAGIVNTPVALYAPADVALYPGIVQAIVAIPGTEVVDV